MSTRVGGVVGHVRFRADFNLPTRSEKATIMAYDRNDTENG